jgi:antirestriction protein ArdC
LRRLRDGRITRRAFVASGFGIPTDIPQHASYIAHWIKPLKEDKREIFRAAADAQRIADNGACVLSRLLRADTGSGGVQ